MTRPAALLFDMDGLLLDSERVGLGVFCDLLEPHGVAHDAAEEFYLTLVGTSGEVTLARLTEYLPGADTVSLMRAWREAVSERVRSNPPLMTGVAECLPALYKAGHRMAVVTSTKGWRARGHLEAAGLIHYFELVVGGDEVTAHKPDPAPYLETAVALGVEASDCAAFEDSDRGLTAAARAGCRAVQIPDLRPVDAPLPDLGQMVAKNLPDALSQLGLLCLTTVQ